MNPQDGDDAGRQPSASQTGRPLSQPTLLPAFEPQSSSPVLPRAVKRKHDERAASDRVESQHYPTPVPTSSTAVPPSSSPSRISTRPGLQRTLSAVSERAPLAAVPSVDLPVDGDPILMGRSSNSSHYTLSANRLISRVHVRAMYRPAENRDETPAVEIECLGWNGAKVHCRGQVFELGKGHTFTSDKPQSEIMLDVQDARVMIRWPSVHRANSISALSDATWEEETSPTRMSLLGEGRFASSPPLSFGNLQSPVSPSPRGRSSNAASRTFLGAPQSSSEPPAVQVYEDSPPAAELGDVANQQQAPVETINASNTALSQISHASSGLSELHEFSDQDEENDPIIHSFGEFGEGILPRMASINATSPERRRQPLKTSVSPRQSASTSAVLNLDTSAISNHVVNQLAFSRLHALPLSTIMSNLPATLREKADDYGEKSEDSELQKQTLTNNQLKKLLDETPCVGEIPREGKDAAGKALEHEFYYIPEMDTDEARRNAVENSLGKPGLRAVRKQHKQYFWKRPRH